MTNIVQKLRSTLKEQNYVRKADPESNYFFDFTKPVVDRYIAAFGDQFNLIIYGSDEIENDFFVLPFGAFKHIFSENNIAQDKNRSKRWIGRIVFNELQVTHDRIRPDISAYYGNYDLLNSTDGIPTVVTITSEEDRNDYAIENRKAEIKVRQKQSVFRSRVLTNFENRCCLTGIRETELLVGSHIVPWSDRIETRLDPHNGLCLFVLYDSLFDQGYFSLSDELTVIITPMFENLSPELKTILYKIENQGIRKPKKYSINPQYLLYHRKNVFKT